MTATADVQDRLHQVLPGIRSAAEAVDRDGSFPADQVRSLGDAGLLGLIASPEVGGLGAGPREFVDTMLGVAGACGSTSMVYLMHLSASAVTAAAPPETGGSDLLAGLASGQKLGTLAFSEKGSRSHFWAPVSKAVRTGGGISLVAEKSWVTSATKADVYVASAMAPDSAGPTESNLYVVDRCAPGVEVQGRFEGVGLRGNDSAPVHLDVALDEGCRLGDEASGFGLMMQVVLPWFCLGNSAVSLGLARSALESAIEHASGSRFEHLDSTLSDLPTIRAYLAKGWADLTAHEALLRHTADLVAAPNDQTVLGVLTSKAACNEAALRITDIAMRVAGGAGFSKHLGIERYARDARAGFVMAPTSDALFDFAGRALCGLDLF
jgi:alkylation response protein AidB-like acyl-CoA dehydrogenase